VEVAGEEDEVKRVVLLLPGKQMLFVLSFNSLAE
jgi:hypothetical protein